MEKLTYVANKKINKKVIKIIETLKRELISNFHPKSIVLIGSFGKGEAMVVEKKGKLQFLSDCEILLIPNLSLLNKKNIEQFSKHFFKKTGLNIQINGFQTNINLLLPFLKNRFKPTIYNYDLKYGSKIIYGKNYLDRIPQFKPEDIPIWEGIRLLFNRMAEAIKFFSYKPSNNMIFWTDKIILACQDSLLLVLGRYQPSYKKRNEIFNYLFLHSFQDWEDKPLNLLMLAKNATKRRLTGETNINDPIKHWADTEKICDKVLRYIIQKYTGIKFNEYLEFHDKYLKYSEIVGIHAMLENYEIFIKNLFFKRILPIKLIEKAKISWRQIVYSLTPFVYFNSSRNLKMINEEYIDKAEKELSMFFKKSKDHNDNVLEKDKLMRVQRDFLNTWDIICY